MNNRLNFLVNILCTIITVVGIIISLFATLNKSESIYSYLSLASSIISTLFWLYCNLLWKIPKLSNLPKIYGHYIVEINPIDSPNAKKVVGEMRIKQNFIRTSIKAVFDESSSYALCSYIDTDFDTLIYTYQSTTLEEKRFINPDKVGTARLIIINKNELRGKYFTTALSQGDMICRRIK